MSDIVSRDAIATWFFDPEAGGRYLQPPRVPDQAKRSSCAGPEVEYVGVLANLSDQNTKVPKLTLLSTAALAGFLQGAQRFTSTTGAATDGDTVDAEHKASSDASLIKYEPNDPPQNGLLVVPLPLTESQVLKAEHQPSTGIPTELSDALTSARVIHAVIDDTILPIHHHTRLPGGGTRYAAIWHQDGIPQKGQSAEFGRVWYRDDIDTIIKEDSASIRRAFGHDVGRKTGLPTGAIAVSHGGAVVDLFAGFAPRADLFDETLSKYDDRPIIGVQLPAQVFWDSAGLALGFFISKALDFIFKVADDMGGGCVPLVINFSYGMTAGPHDGSSFIERVIDKQLRERRKKAPTELVLPVGNDYRARHSWRQKGEAVLPVEVPPARARPVIVETWFTWPQQFIRDDKTLSVKLSGANRWTTPTLSLKLGDTYDLTEASVAFGRIAFENNPADALGDVRHRLSLMLAPTHHPDPACPVTRPGLWTLEIAPPEGPEDEITFQTWIQRDDDPVGFPGRTPPVRFRYPDTVTEMEQRRFTASAKVTGKRSVIAAGWRLSDGRIAPYSASYDPAENPSRRDHDNRSTLEKQYVFAAPSESSAALPGLRAAGNIGGRGGALRGTSAAAPVLARVLAHMLASLPTAVPEGLKIAETLATIIKPGGHVQPPLTLAKRNPASLPGHVLQSDWLGTPYGDRHSIAWTGEPAEYSQSRIGQGFCAPRDKALTRIRRK